MENQNEVFEKNLNYLENQLKYTGMPLELNIELKKAMENGKESFQLFTHKEYGSDKVDAVLNFNKSELGYYFFNNYNLTLSKENEQNLSKTFRVEYGRTFSLKEAYNMLDSRSVHKTFTTNNDPLQEPTKTNAWNYIDFKNTSESGEFLIRQKYNYNLEAELAKLPIKNFHIPQVKLDLMDSLKKGNTQQTILQLDGNDVKVNLEANPRYGGMIIYNEAMERINVAYSKVEENKLAEGQNLAPESNNVTPDDKPNNDQPKVEDSKIQDDNAPEKISESDANQNLAKDESAKLEGQSKPATVVKENVARPDKNKESLKETTKTENRQRRSRRVG